MSNSPVTVYMVVVQVSSDQTVTYNAPHSVLMTLATSPAVFVRSATKITPGICAQMEVSGVCLSHVENVLYAADTIIIIITTMWMISPIRYRNTGSILKIISW